MPSLSPVLLSLRPDDLTRLRFATSPWWEAVTAVLALTRDTPLHRPWARATRAALASDPDAARQWDVLRAFILPSGLIIDALTPTPARDETFEESYARVVAQDPALWLADITLMTQRADRPASAEVLAQFAGDADAGIRRLCDAVAWFWRVAVEPHWERIRALQVADIDHRMRLLSRGGVEEMLRTLHPQVRRVPDGLELTGKVCTISGRDGEPGLMLIPCVFAWPGTLVLAAPGIPTLSYAPRGVGALWESRDEQFHEDAVNAPLAALMGATRATVLRQLDIPMTTTQLSHHLRISPAAASEHLKVLAGARLLDARRRGREVFYRRTRIAEELLQD